MASPSEHDLAGSPLLQALSPDERQAAAALFTIRSYPKNAIIVSEGDRLGFFSIVLAGRVKFYWRDETGHQVDVAVVGPHEDFAAQALGGEPILTTIAALEPLRLATIPLDDFERLLLRHPRLAVSYVKRVVFLFRRTTMARRSFAMEDVYGRVTELLVANAKEVDGHLVTERFTHAEIGQRVGATREMVGRVLRELARGGYITADRGRFTVLRRPPRHW
ncbi:MAG TPA: Crp/Fnr family transcriptional regulator [Burkholderiaceae bacterium]|nr:Crp/Fnr family transcriptional regulator [Burkholderiaceae bacterium]